MIKIVIPLIFLIPFISFAQDIVYFNTLYNDSFSAWNIEYVNIHSDEDAELLQGSLELTWGMANKWNDYSFNLDGIRSRVTYKELGTMDMFELQDWDNNNVLAKKVWPRDPTEWVLTLDNTEYKLELLFKNDNEEWIIKSNNVILCNILTTYKGDLRDWFFDYKTDEKIPLSIQQLAIVTIIYLVCPKI